MKSDRLRSYARRKIYRIRRLRRGNALATSTARASAAVPPRRRHNRRAAEFVASVACGWRASLHMVHGVLLARAGRQIVRALPHPAPFRLVSANAHARGPARVYPLSPAHI